METRKNEIKKQLLDTFNFLASLINGNEEGSEDR